MYIDRTRRDLFRAMKCWASGLPLEFGMGGEGGKNKDQWL